MAVKREAVDWEVAFVSIVRTIKQASKSDDEILEHLLREAETNLQWEYAYMEERVKILPQGLWFMKKTLYRRIQIVACYLYALKKRRIREGKSTQNIPITLMIEVILRPSKTLDFAEIVNIRRPTAIPFSPEFKFDTVRRELMKSFIYVHEVKFVRVLIKLHVRSPIMKRNRAVGEGDFRYDSDEEMIGSDKWLDNETSIDYEDRDALFATRRNNIGHIEIVMIKPIFFE